MFDALKVIAKKDKMPGLYRGIGPTLLSIAPLVAIQQVTYDLLKYKAGNMNIEPSVFLFLGCGSLAGVAAQTVCTYFENLSLSNTTATCHLCTLLGFGILTSFYTFTGNLSVGSCPA